MIKNLSLSLLSTLVTLGICLGQVPVGKWRDHFSFSRVKHVAVSPKLIYAASDNGVFYYNPTDGQLAKITRINGLSDVGITAIAYSPYQDMLAVGYENGNVDLLNEGVVVNIPYIKQKAMQGSKQINHFLFISSSEVLVSTAFGIVAVNTTKQEVKDTYYIGEEGSSVFVNATALRNGIIYAATANGLRRADSGNPLLIHFENWALEEGLPISSFTKVVIHKGELIANQHTGNLTRDILWYTSGDSWESKDAPFNEVGSLNASSSGVLVVGTGGIAYGDNVQQLNTHTNLYYGFSSFNPLVGATSENGNLAIGDGYLGLMYGSAHNWTRACPNGPDDDRAFFILPTADDLYVMGGSRSDSWGGRFFPLTVHKLSSNRWTSYLNFDLQDAVRATQNPANSKEIIISTWGHGIAVLRDGAITESYTPENSTLQTIIAGPYCRIGGVAFDQMGNMWVSNAGVANPISVRTADGKWTGFPYQSVVGSERQSDIVASPTGQLWVVIASGGGLLVIEPGANPSAFSSHKYRKIVLSGTEGSPISNDIHSLVFDREGYLWVGTSDGVVVSYNPHKAIDPSAFSISKLKIPDTEPGRALHLLDGQVVTAISIDGGNRKWFGTQRSGAYLQSADGTQELLHFTMENSPLPSNNIIHIGIHPQTGEVFFATDKGTISYRGDATEAAKRFGRVYAFPNPVRPNHAGPITITGLVEKAIVKITDVSGNLVYETTSEGGQASWDGKNINGQRVATGVYLYFCSDSEGKETAVGKILFVK